jgi:uncharacterized protein with ATP-grasp and redox domains
MTANPPEFISTRDPGSFARRTITERKPRIIGDVMESNSLSGRSIERLRELELEIREGSVSNPFEKSDFPPGTFEPPEREAWEEQLALYEGRSWLDVPWYFAEAVFYLKLLFAVGYYEGGVPDPFQALKDRELFGVGGGLHLARAAEARLGSSRPPLDRAVFLLRSSLWGNRVDLSNFDVPQEDRESLLEEGGDNLLVDDSIRAAQGLLDGLELEFVMDNAGPELAFDLLLADLLLGLNARARVTLHLKKAPFFVSDSMSKDVLRTIGAFEGDGGSGIKAAGKRLRRLVEEGRLALSDHFFWNGPLHFTRLPRMLMESLSASDLVVFKGDANYRRLLEDRKWKPWTSLDEETSYFPAAFVAVRTMKSEIVADIPREKALALDAEDPDWLTNGKRGIIRYRARGA